ncbi:type II toxin-antitoxin system HicB family antitoxin [Treponema sp. C6A8]|uniref:type II toxin-antitoxin system HicB family antitoxin n=1 Tax=Treponema sp. C6A8 TaxID=1410609 RepID=UPI00048416DE|nr:type II toxin-antitoxin system HicB family antitoxin [Treponema sp. C6A8]
MRYTYTAVFTEKDGKFYARVPDLAGCITTGKTLSDAIEQTVDAMSAWLCVAEDEGMPIPAPTPQAKISYNSGEELSLINADTLKYRALTDTRSVRKNVSLPAWLSKIADKRHFNCSQILQDALMALI